MTARRIAGRAARAERTRRRYQPPRVRVLMVAESPPASGRFFYHADSGLYRAVRDAFAPVHAPTISPTFLESFREHGWYVVDLCRAPVNHLRPPARRQAHAGGVRGLARTVRRLRPRAVVLVVRMISGPVRRALQLAEWSGPSWEVPYPGRWATARRAFATRFRAGAAGRCIGWWPGPSDLGVKRLATRDVRDFAVVRLSGGRSSELIVHPTVPDNPDVRPLFERGGRWPLHPSGETAPAGEAIGQALNGS